MGDMSVKLLLFLFLPVLPYNVNAEVRHLDMSPDAVDDTFTECHDTMMQTVTKPGGLLQKEIETSKDFAEMWRSHDGTCEKQIYGGTPYHLAALQAYGNSKVKFRKEFNQMVQTKGSNSTIYKNKFLFKSLHFLLTDVIRLLNNGTTCSRIYHGTVNTYHVKTGTEVRFGKFLQGRIQDSSETEVVEEEGTGTVFNITSCSAVNIEHYTCTSEEIEQLISPTEVFTVQSIREVKNDDADYKIITLTHSRFLSSHDCYLFHSSVHGGSSRLMLSSVFLALIASIFGLHLQ
ncbi:ecto-ADP-ribosyltransferase 5 [Brachyhypopomus gauderio]|uniref:ecto-ADP-ribosyltransferase 5 n=1 Tax=Brachyhypopomus gauderio TaxID=698409 RepID=UPI00404167C0